MTTYDTASQEVLDLIKQVMEQYHEELNEADVTVDAMFAYDENGDHPVKHGGYPALAYIKVTSLKNRIKGMMDAEITIDGEAYKAMTQPQRIALIDHELHHLIIARDKEENIKLDDANRPKLKIRKHDYQMGWFRDIALRHGDNSPEVFQAKMLWNADANTFFPKVVAPTQNASIVQNEQETNS
jgi:hypothetical protein